MEDFPNAALLFQVPSALPLRWELPHDSVVGPRASMPFSPLEKIASILSLIHNGGCKHLSSKYLISWGRLWIRQDQLNIAE